MRKLYFSEEEIKEAKRRNAKKYYATKNGKLKKKAYDKKKRQECRDERKLYRQKRRQTKEGYIDRFMERIKVKTPDSDITREYILSIFKDVCVITHKSFEYIKTYDAYHNALAPSIDRINSKKGYYVGNVQIILSCINRMKNDMPNEQFLVLWGALTRVDN